MSSKKKNAARAAGLKQGSDGDGAGIADASGALGAAGADAGGAAAGELAADKLRQARWAFMALVAATGLWQVYFPPVNLWVVGLFIPGLYAFGSLAMPAGKKGFFVILAVGFACWAMGIYWMSWATPVGWLLLSLFMGLHWPLGAWCLRKMVSPSGKIKIPLWLAVPLVMVTLELVRAYIFSGFPWFFMGHGLFKHPLAFQIADFSGVYGVSFVISAASAAALQLALWRLGDKSPQRTSGRSCIVAAVFAGVLVAATCGYGAFRLAQTDAGDNAGNKILSPGPRVLAAQSAFAISLYTESDRNGPDIVAGLIKDTEAVAEASGCDLIVWPETVLPQEFKGPTGYDISWPRVNIDALDPQWQDLARMLCEMHADVAAMLDKAGASAMIAGASTFKLDPTGGDDHEIYNSALYITPPTAALKARRELLGFGSVYSKMHCVPFGEYTPFKFTVRPLYDFLRMFVPDQMSQLTPGRRALRYKLNCSDGRSYDFAVAICYEGVMSRVCRRLIWRSVDSDGQPVDKKADFLVNMSNDGWFIWPFGKSQWPSSELDQHLSVYPFRAVENRVSVVRAVNTGISCMVDSCGRFTDIVTDADGRYKMVSGAIAADLAIDSRKTFYGRYGDILPLLCLLLVLIRLIDCRWAGAVKK